MAANICKGFGRYHFKENRNFCTYARGSLCETMTWLQKARVRRSLSEEAYRMLKHDAETLSVKLNKYIRAIGRQKAEPLDPPDRLKGPPDATEGSHPYCPITSTLALSRRALCPVTITRSPA